MVKKDWKTTSVAQSGNRCRLVFQSFFTMIFLQQGSLCVFFHSCLDSALFTGQSLLVVHFARKFLLLGVVNFCMPSAQSLIPHHHFIFGSSYAYLCCKTTIIIILIINLLSCLPFKNSNNNVQQSLCLLNPIYISIVCRPC